MEHNPTFINLTNPHRFYHTNHAKKHMKGTQEGMTRLLVHRMLHRSQGEMLRWERIKRYSKGIRAWQNILQSLSLNPLYQIEEDDWIFCRHKS